MAQRESSSEHFDGVDWIAVAQEKELVTNEGDFVRKEQELNRVKKALDEEKRCKSMREEWEYR